MRPALVRSVPLLLLMLTACIGTGARPRRLTGAGVSPGVYGVLERPQTTGPHPVVILLPGSYGWRSDYASFAKAFADSGFVALALDYYGETGRGSSSAAEKRNWMAWQATVRNAVAYMDSVAPGNSRNIGLVGYSRGAFLAISVAASLPAVGAVVDYYGGGSDADPSDQEIPRFPPLLILHGEADTEISVDLAYRLNDRMKAHGGSVEMHLYPRAQHVFNGPWASTYSPPDAADAWGRTVAFLRTHLTTAPNATH